MNMRSKVVGTGLVDSGNDRVGMRQDICLIMFALCNYRETMGMTIQSTHVISITELVALEMAQRTISPMLVHIWHMLQI
jgi:hypothetical protein